MGRFPFRLFFMNVRYLIFTIVFLLLGHPVLVQAGVQTFHLSERYAKHQITFESKAPVEYIDGQVHRIQGDISLDTSRADLGLQGTIAIPVDAMDTGHAQRDDHLRSSDWMNAASFPTIRFVLDPPKLSDISNKGRDKWVVQAKGSFVMKGVTKKITAPVTLMLKTEGEEKKLFLNGRFSVLLSDFGIRGPTAMRMIGVRVGEEIRINLNMVAVADKGWTSLESHRKGKR